MVRVYGRGIIILLLMYIKYRLLKYDGSFIFY